MRNKNQKFLCRTELTGALGAILAQDQGHLKMNLFFQVCFLGLLAVRNVSCPEHRYALDGIERGQDLLQPPSSSVECIHRDGWGPWRRYEASCCPTSRSGGSIPLSSSTTRWRVLDGHQCVPCRVGLQVGEEDFACERRGRLGQLGRHLTLARIQSQCLRKWHWWTTNNIHHYDREKTENDPDLGSGGRWRLHCGAGGHEGKMVPTIPPNNRGMASGGGRALLGATFCSIQKDGHPRQCPIRGLCNLCAVRSTCTSCFKVSYVCGIPQWLRDERTTRTSIVRSVEILLAGVPHIDVDAGCNDDVNAAQLRGDDGETEPPVPNGLAFAILSGRAGEIIPFEQDKVEIAPGHQEWHQPTDELGSISPMGLCLSGTGARRSILASTSSRASLGMGSSWKSWIAENTGRTVGCDVHPGWIGLHHPHLGQRGKISQEKDKEGEKEEGNKEGRSSWRWRRFAEEERTEGKTEVLCMEQWQWALWGIATWASLCRKSQKGTQMHDLQFPRSPFPILSSEEEWIIKKHPDRARSRSRRARRNDDEGNSRNRDRGRRRRREDDEDERDQGEEDYNVHEARGDPKAKTEEDYLKTRVFRFLHYFAGPNDPLAEALQAASIEEDIRVDIHSVEKQSGTGDLLEDQPYTADLDQAKKGLWDGFHAGFPCGTFTRLRFRAMAGMPGPVRTKSEPYGKKSNSDRQQREADEGTIMAARSITMAKTVATSRPKFKVQPISTLENPPPTDHPEHIAAWELPEMDAFKMVDNCNTLMFHTCKYQTHLPVKQRHYKPQMFMGTLNNIRSLTAFCDCEGGPREHDPVVGKEKSAASGEYPAAFCKAYANLVMQHLRRMGKEEFLTHKMKRLGEQIEITKEMLDKRNVTLVPSAEARSSRGEKASASDPVNPGRDERDEGIPTREDRKRATHSPSRASAPASESQEFQGGDGKHEMLKKSTAKASDPKLLDYVGGMKDPAKVVQPMSNLLSLGLRIKAGWESFCRERPDALEVAESYGTPNCTMKEDVVSAWKTKLRRLVGAKGAPSLKVTGKFEYKSPLDPELVEAWCAKGNDPEKHVATWIRQGAPLGIEKEIPVCGIFPSAMTEDLDHKGEAELLDAEAQLARGDIHNYVSVTSDPANAKIELDRYVKEGYTKVVAKDEVMSDMKHGTISRLGLIVKEKPEGVKRRIIIDLRRSGGNSKATLPEKLVLPRPRDMVESIRSIFSQRRQEKEGSDYARELVVIDVSDAFMSLGVHGEELPHTLAPHVEDQEAFYLFSALLFGYKTAPLLWSRVAAMLARMLQSLMTTDEAQHQVYLDDAIWVLQGGLKDRNLNLSLILVTMAALGFRVSLKKGERSTQVLWIGVQFSLHNDILLVTVPKKFIATLLEMLRSWKGMASVKELRVACGRISWLSGLLPRTRWVVSVFYKVLHQRLADVASGAEEQRRANREDDRKKDHMFHVKQLEQPLRWLEAYLSASVEQPVKKYKLDINKYPKATIITDASPEGLGGVLLVNNRLVKAFSSPVMEHDAEELNFQYMESASQGAVEALAILVAVRLWHKELASCRVDLKVQSDSVTALALTQKLSNRNATLNFIGGELAVQCERIGIESITGSHLPGAANTVADFLSRPSKWKDVSMPEDLRGINIQTPEARVEGWYALPTPKQAPHLWLSDQTAENAWASLRQQ